MSLPPIWPSVFPLWPHVDSVSGALQPGHVGFEPEQGMPIERPGQTVAIEEWRVTFPATDRAAMLSWRAFYDTDLKGGVLRFAWVHPMREVLREVSIAKTQNSPSWQHVPGGTWRLSLSVRFVDVDPSWSALVEIAGNEIRPLP